MKSIYDQIHYDILYEEEYDALLDEIVSGKRVSCSDENCTGIIGNDLECETCGKYYEYNRDDREIDKIAYILSVSRKRKVTVGSLINSLGPYGDDKQTVVKALEDIDKILDIINISRVYGRDSTKVISSMNLNKDTKSIIEKMCQNHCIVKHLYELKGRDDFLNLDINSNVKMYSIDGYRRLSYFITFVSLVISFFYFMNFYRNKVNAIENSLLFSVISCAIVYFLIRFLYWVLDGFSYTKNKYVKIC